MRVSTGAGTAVGDAVRRWPRYAALGSATVLTLVAASTAAGGWYYADELLQVKPDPPDYPIEVIAASDGVVVLNGAGADEPGLLGLEWDGGYARVGDDVRIVDGHTVRTVIGYPDLPAAGTMVRLDGYAAPAHLAVFARVSALTVDDVEYAGPLGSYPATQLRADGPHGESRRWVVHVHGRGANRAEAHRVMPALHRLGFQQLSVAYRNDAGAPATPSKTYGLGWTESEDLAAALAHVRELGATQVVLMGYSMGAAVVGNYLRTHGSADVDGLVYDSPALSWPDILAYQAKARNLPAFGGRIATGVVRARTGIQVVTMDQVANADRHQLPTLLFHGANDLTVPVTSSDAFAEARPDLVTYVRTDGGHVRNWNVGPARYQAALETFLAGIMT